MKESIVKKVIDFHENSTLSIRAISLLVKISRPSVSKIIKTYDNTDLSYDDFCVLQKKDFEKIFTKRKRAETNQYLLLMKQLPEIKKKLKNNKYITVWEDYRNKNSEH
jgi:hypothetical protein